MQHDPTLDNVRMIFHGKNGAIVLWNPADCLESGTPIDDETGEDLEYVGLCRPDNTHLHYTDIQSFSPETAFNNSFTSIYEEDLEDWAKDLFLDSYVFRNKHTGEAISRKDFLTIVRMEVGKQT